MFRSYLVWGSLSCLSLDLLPLFTVSYPKKNIARTYASKLPSVFYSRSFKVSGLKFIHFDLFLCMVWDRGPVSCFGMKLSGFLNTIYWMTLVSFFIAYILLLCGKLIYFIYMGLFLSSLFCYTGLFVCIYYIIMLFKLLCNIFWIQGMWCLQFCPYFSGLPWLFMVFCGSIWNFKIVLSISVKKIPSKFW